MAALDAAPLRVLATSMIVSSAPVGPSIRRYANAAVIVESALEPPALLGWLKQLERRFGRRGGRRWGPRTMDLDILLWTGGRWTDKTLSIPHRHLRNRIFVLAPLVTVAPHWRDPVTARSVRQIWTASLRPKPVDRIDKRH
jgi:2-amino-4-hydroxy-6-hydroxymethyldihydropteridine diphosphokinase